MAQVLCILALLCSAFAVYIAENTDIDYDFRDLQVQRDSLSWSDKLQNKQDLTKTQSLVDSLHKVFKSQDGIFLKDTEMLEKNRRGLDSENTTQYQRKPGCRVFYWKSWTAC